MLTEFRRYSVAPGCMSSMHERMQGLLLPLFPDHGVPVPSGIWENSPDRSVLSWVLEWPDFETRQAAWQSIAPAFAAARQQQGGDEFVTRTTLTMVSPWPGHSLDLGGFRPSYCETAWHIQPRVGHGSAFIGQAQGLFDQWELVGARQVTAFNLLFGALPQVLVLIGWDSQARRNEGMARISRMPAETIAPLVLGQGESFEEYGEWEALDRAPYLAVQIAA
jgi:hypothetical protein